MGLGGFCTDVDLSVNFIEVEVKVKIVDDAAKTEKVTDEKKDPSTETGGPPR